VRKFEKAVLTIAPPVVRIVKYRIFSSQEILVNKPLS
jgi:hypothetical protein